MHDITLIHASVRKPEVEKAQPLGVMCLAAVARREGVKPRLVDMKAHDLTARQVVDSYKNDQTPVVGLSCITFDHRAVHEIAAGIKAVNPAAVVLAGGSHATAYCDDLLADRNIDAAVLYEGEDTLMDALRALDEGRPLDGVEGLAFARDGRIVRTPARALIEDLDSLPLPAWDMIDLPRYWRIPRLAWIYKHREYAVILTTRGCPYRCAYCHQTLGKTWRTRSIPNVIEEIRLLREKYGVREIVPVDDMFNLSDERTRQFAQALIDADLGVALHFPVGFRIEILTDETIRLLKRAGMYRCMVGIETASTRIQGLLNRNTDLKKTREMIRRIAANGILVHGVFILGLPTETEEEMRGTVDYAMRSDLHSIAVSIAIPFKNSGLVELARAGGVEFQDDFDNYSFTSSHVNLTKVPTRVILRLRRSMYRRFFTPRRMARFFRLLPHPWTHFLRLGVVFIRRAFIW